MNTRVNIPGIGAATVQFQGGPEDEDGFKVVKILPTPIDAKCKSVPTGLEVKLLTLDKSQGTVFGEPKKKFKQTLLVETGSHRSAKQEVQMAETEMDDKKSDGKKSGKKLEEKVSISFFFLNFNFVRRWEKLTFFHRIQFRQLAMTLFLKLL
jgi:hypothetical protein